MATNTSATNTVLTTVNQIVNSSSVTRLSTYSYRKTSSDPLVYGGAAVYGTNSIAIWNGTTTPTVATLPTGVTAADVTKIVASDSGLMILTRTGDLYTRGAATSDASTWTRRATGIVDFSMWGFTTDKNYLGGMMIDSTGKAYRFFSTATGGWLTPQVVNVGTTTTPLTNVVKTFSSDGTYMLLTADGKVYAAGGNLDNSGRTGAQTVDLGSGVVVRDLNVWGHHIGTNYHGGGFVITGALGC